MEQLFFDFTYNGNVVLSAVTNEVNTVQSLPSGTFPLEWTDYSDPDNPVTTDTLSNYYFYSPSYATQDFARFSTELTLEEEGNGVWLDCEYHGIRLKVKLTHEDNIHHVTISGFQKKFIDDQGEVSYYNMYANTWSNLSATWDSSQGESMHLALGIGDVNYSGYASQVQSVSFQLRKFKNGQYEYASGTCNWENNVFNFVPDPEHTYEPTDNTVVIGGTGNGDYPSDPAERPNVGNLNSWFAFSSSNGKGLTYYNMLISDMYEIFSKIYSNSYINLETRLKAIIDCFRIPFTVNVGNQISTINVADVPVRVTMGAYPLTQRFKEIDFPIVDLRNAGWDDYNDFSNTRASLYLPFVGRINIDINAIARGTIEVVAVCDGYTGNVSYWIYTTSMNAPREVLYGIYEGQSAVQIPIASTYNPNLVGKMISLGASTAGLITGIATENPAAIIKGAAGTLGGLTAFHEQNVDTSHLQDSASVATSPLHIRLDISRREMIRPEQYRETAGIGAFTTEVLRNLEGFVRVHSADYDGLSCEQEEKMIIKQMFEEGVYV